MFISFFKEQKEKIKKFYQLKRTPIKKKVQKRGHKFSIEVKRAIMVRDQGCINPHCTREDWSFHCHHVFYHRGEKIFDFEEANKADKGVLLCNTCHDSLHFRSNLALDRYCHQYLLKP